MHYTSYMLIFLYKLYSIRLTQVSSCVTIFFFILKKHLKSSYDKMKNDRKEKCNDIGNKHILKANLSLFYDIYLSSYTQEHLA